MVASEAESAARAETLPFPSVELPVLPDKLRLPAPWLN
jgi:hypothetical protein